MITIMLKTTPITNNQSSSGLRVAQWLNFEERVDNLNNLNQYRSGYLMGFNNNAYLAYDNETNFKNKFKKYIFFLKGMTINIKYL